ncbi:MAG: hypothetical protein K6G05_05120 [Lachnospiraceae bacterium]|nr:hypothetical protein [Lachnospiraceae bacterium]
MKKLMMKIGLSKLIGGAVIVIGAVAFLTAGAMLMHRSEAASEEVTEENEVTDPAEVVEEDETATEIAESAIIPGFTVIEVEADKAEVESPFYNSEENAVTLQITLTLEDGTVIYTSEELQPGEELDTMTLSRALTAGDYQAVLHYDVFAMDENHTELNGADIDVVVRAE